jgi:positive regulator of sigma E activity
MFKDNNDINEKSVIGFMAFIVMIGFAVADIITGYLGKDLVVNEFIFNAFLVITLGCFSISSVDKYINKKSENTEE